MVTDAVSSTKAQQFPQLLRLGCLFLVAIITLYVVWSLYLAGQPLFAVILMALGVGLVIIFGSNRFYAARFIFPAVATILLFIVLPVVFTSYLGFTNYSSTNLLDFQRARAVHLEKRDIDASTERPFKLVSDGAMYRVFLPDGTAGLLSDPFDLTGLTATIPVAPVLNAPPEILAMRDVVKLRGELGEIALLLPDNVSLRLSGLRNFAAMTPLYQEQQNGQLHATDGTILSPDQSLGFYTDQSGKTIAPGWRVEIGWANFRRVLFSDGMREPMLAIFVWTFAFAFLSVFLTFTLGLLLALILQWPHLRFKALYRVLLILPYAVPAFISILVFRGLFNQNFGEINLILEAIFGIKPQWFTDGTTARTMLVMVNVWLGYPYMMLLSMGFLQGIPEDHKKAAALEGAGAARVFFKITLPQILPPFLPMLIASFAFNFNNIVLVLLLTAGLPDIPGTLIPAGQTDILGSFTYRISFLDSGQNFGLAGAIATLVFLLVGGIAYANFAALRYAANRNRSA